MFFHILSKDLKRKKTMNIILLIFIILSSLFMSSSVNNLITVSSMVDSFIEEANVPDFFTMAVTNSEEDELADFLEKSKDVADYQIMDTYTFSENDIKLQRAGAAGDDEDKYKRSNITCVCPVPENFMKIFDAEGNPLKLNRGEIAVPRVEAEANNLVIGDILKIKKGEIEKEFTVKEIVKDAVFGSTMMGFKRYYICEEDFADYDFEYKTRIYSINYQDEESFQKEYKKLQINTISNIDKGTVKICYVMDMLISAILIIVSVCLILIAFLILKFTINFTLQENYKEIGIMKAIGITDWGIKRIYLCKYFVLAVAGSVMGLFFSVPFGNLLLEKTVVNINISTDHMSMGVNVLCAASIIVIVMLFCYLSTNKVNDFSVMQAIRNGSNGERYHSKVKIKLHNRKHMKTYFYLAVNDLTSNFRRFAILGTIFCIGTMLIQLPLSAVTTLQSEELVRTMSLNPSDAYISIADPDKYMVESSTKAIEEELQEIKDILMEHGLKSETRAEVGYMVQTYAKNPDDMYSYLTLQSVGDDAGDYTLLEGENPKLENELIITEKTAKEMGVGIGDSIYYSMEADTKEFIITGIYQTMMNMGDGYRVSESARMDYSYTAGIYGFQIELLDYDRKEACEKIKEVFPSYEVKNYKQYMAEMMGSIVEQMDELFLFIVGIVFVINCLITVLIMKTMITKERSQIAMMKSIGIGNRSLKAWQSARILVVLLLAILLGTIFSNLLAPLTVGQVFGMMGASKMKLIINPLEAYVIYPLALLLVTGLAGYLCAGQVRHIDLKEVNNQE